MQLDQTSADHFTINLKVGGYISGKSLIQAQELVILYKSNGKWMLIQNYKVQGPICK